MNTPLISFFKLKNNSPVQFFVDFNDKYLDEPIFISILNIAIWTDVTFEKYLKKFNVKSNFDY